MADLTHKLKQEISELQKQIQELQSSLTEERVSNLEFDQTQKEQKIKIDELTDLLANEKLKNQQLSQQLQELQIQTDEKTHNFQEQTHNFQQYIAQQHQQIQQFNQQLLVQNNIIKQLQMNHHDDEYGKYDIKFEDDGESDSDQLETNKELRHRLLEEQMIHEQLKNVHRQSISKLEQYELDQLQEYNNNNNNTMITNNDNENEDIEDNNNDKLREEIDLLRRQLDDEKKKRENLDKERRNSLAALSQNMFKKLLDSEHQHYDDKSDLEKQCDTLKKIVKYLEKSKQNLLQETSKTIDDLREHIKFLSIRLQKYENWD